MGRIIRAHPEDTVMRERTRWEILGIRQLAAADERAETFAGTLLVQVAGGAEPVEPVEVTVTRPVLEEVAAYLARLLARSRGRG
jgi:hypothetical protein